MVSKAPPIYLHIAISCEAGQPDRLSYIRSTADARRNIVIPVKCVDNPRSPYHVWLENRKLTPTKRVPEPSSSSGPNLRGIDIRGTSSSSSSSVSWESNASQMTVSQRIVMDEKITVPQITTMMSNVLLDFTRKSLFDNLNKLNWPDKDVRIVRDNELKIFNKTVALKILLQMEKLSIDLEKKIIEKIPTLWVLPKDEKKNILFHIISKGEQFYTACLREIEFCIYLFEQHQPLHTMLVAYTN